MKNMLGKSVCGLAAAVMSVSICVSLPATGAEGREDKDIVVSGSPCPADYMRSLLPAEFSDSSISTDLFPGDTLRLTKGTEHLCFVNKTFPAADSELLMFSDHPERVCGRGLLFKGGLVRLKPVRLQYYHEGGADGKTLWMRMAVSNFGNRKARIFITEGQAGPDEDYFKAGHGCCVEFLNRTACGCGRVIEIEPHGTAEIVCAPLEYEKVVSGAVQMTLLDGSGIVFALCACEEKDEDLSFGFLSNPKDVHARGIYASPDIFASRVWNMEKQAEVRTAIGAMRQPNITSGPDLRGDYGAVCALNFLILNPSSERRRFELVFNPRGGKAAACVLVNLSKAETGNAAGWLKGQEYSLGTFCRRGADRGGWSDASCAKEQEAFTETVLGTFEADADSAMELRLLTMPEGASNYPVRFILRPAKE